GHHRHHAGASDHEHQPEGEHREDQVEYRPRGDDGDALPDRLAGELHVTLVVGNVALARVQHFHVSTQGDGGDAVFGAVTAGTAPQGTAEAHREAQHLHAAAARHPV